MFQTLTEFELCSSKLMLVFRPFFTILLPNWNGCSIQCHGPWYYILYLNASWVPFLRLSFALIALQQIITTELNSHIMASVIRKEGIVSKSETNRMEENETQIDWHITQKRVNTCVRLHVQGLDVQSCRLALTLA